MKKAVVLLLLLAMAFPFVTSMTACKSQEYDTVTYLMCGYDDAGFNTDSIIIAKYSFSKNEACFLQIPRDTYYSNAPYHKINSLFPDALSKGATKAEAMSSLKDSISEMLGIRIDAYIGYTMQTFVNLVDAIGGISLTLNSDFAIRDSAGETILALRRGENHLCGSDALKFVRSRNGYTSADIGRIDAQKRFLAAFVSKVKSDVTLSNVIKLCIQPGNGWTFDAKIGDLINILIKNRGRISNINTKYTNIPGAQVRDAGGVWYYSVSKPLTLSLLSDLNFTLSEQFDHAGYLLNKSNPDFIDIYNSKDLQIKVYDDRDLLSDAP